MMLKNKIVLGTANFGAPYGLTNKNFKKDELEKIFSFCKKNHINFLDTSSDYKNSENIIGKLNNNQLDIITKM